MTDISKIILEHFFNYEFVYVFFLLSFVILFVSAFVRNKNLKKYLFSVSSVFLCLAVAELVLSFILYNPHKYLEQFYPKFSYLNFSRDDKIIKAREIKLKNNLKYFALSDNSEIKLQAVFKNKDFVYNAEYSLYEKSHLRYTRSGENKEDKDAFVFLGCSFTFGEGLSDEFTLPYLFSEKYNFGKTVFNLGIEGMSTNAALNILNSDVLRQYPGIKFRHFFYSLMRDHKYRNFREPGDEGPSDNMLCKDGKISRTEDKFSFVKSVLIRSILFRKIFLPVINEKSEKKYDDYMVASLIKIRNTVRDEFNSGFTVICWDVEYLDKYLTDSLKSSGLDVIFLPDKFDSQKTDYRIKLDGHPSEKANRELADMLYNHIVNKYKT